MTTIATTITPSPIEGDAAARSASYEPGSADPARQSPVPSLCRRRDSTPWGYAVPCCCNVGRGSDALERGRQTRCPRGAARCRRSRCAPAQHGGDARLHGERSQLEPAPARICLTGHGDAGGNDNPGRRRREFGSRDGRYEPRGLPPTWHGLLPHCRSSAADRCRNRAPARDAATAGSRASVPDGRVPAPST